MDRAFTYFRSAMLALDALALTLLFYLFFNSPLGFTPWIVWSCLGIFYFLAALTIAFAPAVLKERPSVLTTEFAFTLFTYILFFMPYQQHLLGMLDYTVSVRLVNTYGNYANPAIIAATIAQVGFHLGTVLMRRPAVVKIPETREDVHRYDWFDRLLPFVLILAMVGYVAAGFHPADTSRYEPGARGGQTDGNPIADGLYLIIITLCLVCVARVITVLARKQKLTAFLWIAAAAVFTWMMHIVLGGDRNNFIVVALSAACGVAALVVRMRLPIVVVAIAVTLLGYNAIEIYRVLPDPSFGAFYNAVTHPSASAQVQESSFNTTTVTLRAAFDVVPSKVDIAYGFYFLVGMMGVVPLIRGKIFGADSSHLMSTDVLNAYVLGPNAGWSLGTNYITDAYMNFGLVGIPLVSALIGVVVAASRLNIQRNGLSTKGVFLFTSMAGLMGEIPRYAIDFPIRVFIWGYVLLTAYEIFHRYFLANTIMVPVRSRKL